MLVIHYVTVDSFAHTNGSRSPEVRWAANDTDNRIRELVERYATPLPNLTEEVETLAARVEEHLTKMGAIWK